MTDDSPHHATLPQDTVIESAQPLTPADPPSNKPALTPIRITLFLALLTALGYAAYQRIGTTAGADLVVYIPNLAGGFVAIGRTADRPGFLLLSELDQQKVTINVSSYANKVAGDFSVIRVETPTTQWQHRLRGPQLMLIDESGAITASDANWSLADLDAIEKATDCEAGISKRCGAPFADLADYFAAPSATIPAPTALLEFVKKHRIVDEGDSIDSAHAHAHHDHDHPQ